MEGKQREKAREHNRIKCLVYNLLSSGIVWVTVVRRQEQHRRAKFLEGKKRWFECMLVLSK